jgi:hypothetical protein
MFGLGIVGLAIYAYTGLLGKFLRNLKVGFKLSPTFFFSLIFGRF